MKKKFGGIKKVRIFAARFGKDLQKRQFIDNIERHKEVKKKKRLSLIIRNSSFFELRLRDCNFIGKTFETM